MKKLVLVLALALGGCSSIKYVGQLYGGCRYDIYTLRVGHTGDKILAGIDLPFSFVFDTAFLPFVGLRRMLIEAGW